MRLDLNPHLVGIIMKEMVRRAIVAVRNERQAFEVFAKEGHSGQMDDMCTTADQKAQQVYLKTIRECFPTFGVVAEEDGLCIPSTHPSGAYFTIDPLDGTKAFVRKQSHGVGTMIALIVGNEVVSAYVGDINTCEIYGYRPESQKVHRITEFQTSEVLGPGEDKPLADQHALLRDPAGTYSSDVQALVAKFKSHSVDGGSIGTWLARLWKREVQVAFINASVETPWDLAPIYGISIKLGYHFFYKPLARVGGNWIPYVTHLVRSKYRREHDLVVIHENDLTKLF